MIKRILWNINEFLKSNWLLFFYVCSIIYFEFLYGLWTNRSIGRDFIFPVLFAVPAGAVLFFLSSLYKKTRSRIISIVITILLMFGYLVYLVYFEIFKVPLSLYSITGAGDALQFRTVINEALLNCWFPIILFFVPVIFLIIFSGTFAHKKLNLKNFLFPVILIAVSLATTYLAVAMTKSRHNSQYMLYYRISSPQLSVTKLGLMTTVRLDLQRLIADRLEKDTTAEEQTTQNFTQPEFETQTSSTIPVTTRQTTTKGSTATTTQTSIETTVYIPRYNVIDIDFDKLIENESNQTVKDMHLYFSAIEPSLQNEYTGIFKGHNLIFIVAESFAPYAVREDLTPTLHMMINSGFVFNDFYTPLFGVSTSDGEYVACTGLLPKTGVWSFYISGRNDMPFAFGNQFKRLGYTTKAYHNHTYTYYSRHVSHPNMGYEYKGVGNGLDIKVTWPESDLEMIEVTTPEYINDPSFHIYYLTVSGHLQYNFGGNYISKKNREYVEHLELSTASKAYLACNLELEFAMRELIARLDEAGVLDNTVIAISADHYPYGLPKSSIDELSGKTVEGNFELYKNAFILWKAGMDPVIVEKTASSLDIAPTIANLFGLEYDSRLYMGNDILSDAPPLIIFANRSWITDRARYNSMTGKVTFFDEDDKDQDYVKSIHEIVKNKFKYSALILDNNYFGRLKAYIDER